MSPDATLIKKALQDVIVPELHAIRGDIRVLDQKVIGLDEKIDSMKVSSWPSSPRSKPAANRRRAAASHCALLPR